MDFMFLKEMGQLLPARVEGAPAYYSSQRWFEDWKLIQP
jgi:hypothetical protein